METDSSRCSRPIVRMIGHTDSCKTIKATTYLRETGFIKLPEAIKIVNSIRFGDTIAIQDLDVAQATNLAANLSSIGFLSELADEAGEEDAIVTDERTNRST